MKFGLNITKDISHKIFSTVQAISHKRLRIGLDDPEKARIAAILEVGSPAMNLPPRPIMALGVKNAEPAIVKAFAAGAVKSLATFSASPMDQAWHAAGQAAVAEARKVIDAGNILAPLAPSTIAARRRRGNPSITPRFDTGETYANLTYYIE